MKVYLVEQHAEDGAHWLVSADSPNSGNALDCGSDKALAKRLVSCACEPPAVPHE